MSGQKYPTLSASLFTYTKLMKHLNMIKVTAKVQTSHILHGAINAAFAKLDKYFDCSTWESEYYYYACGTVLFLGHRLCVLMFIS